MPAISLVVCVYREGELLARLLRHAAGCYDELVVVHDGPDSAGVGAVVAAAGGRFFEAERRGSLEGQSAFAWAQARHEWILRLDADELPGEEMQAWLQAFRRGPEPAAEISGHTCIWPLWNGRRAVTKHWPAGRIFLFHRQRVRFFGLVEQTPIPDGRWQPVPLILRHEPGRKSYGIRNVVFRSQAYHWRATMARALLGKPTDLPCWRWTEENWPEPWRQLRRHPLRHALKSLLWFPLCQIKDMARAGEWPRPSACLNPGLHHFLLGGCVWREQRRQPKRKP